MFFSDISYAYLVGGTEASKWIYLLAGIFVPLLIGRVVEKMKGVGGRFLNRLSVNNFGNVH